MRSSGDDINLLEYVSVLVKRKKMIGAITGAVSVLSVIISLLLPNYYAATASVMRGIQEDSLKASLIMAIPEGLNSLAGGMIGSSSLDAWVGILESNSVRDEIIRRFNLRDVYDKKTIEDTRKVLDSRVVIKSTKEDVLFVTVEDRNPEKATEMANAFVEELDRINKDAVMTSGKSTRLFVEKRLVEVRNDLARIEEEIRAFQNVNKAHKLDDQSTAIIESYGELKDKLAAKEVQLQVMLSYATDSNPQVQMLKVEVDGLRKLLHNAQEGSLHDIFIPTDRLTDLALHYARLVRNAKVQETLFQILTQQYELARIQEAKDSPTLQVLDRATIPERKSRPKRGFIVIVATFSALIVALFLAFFAEYLQRMRRKAD